MEEDDDDIYGSLNAGASSMDGTYTNGTSIVPKQEEDEDGEPGEENENEEDDSESDIDIITERVDAPQTSSTQDFKRVKQEPVRIATDVPATATKSQSQSQSQGPVKTEITSGEAKLVVRDGSKYPEFRHSAIDLHSTPLYDPAGKPITEVDLDADIAMETKPWRVPGTDPTDFFNYGFDEFTWVQYCMKQSTTRSEVTGLRNETKQFEAMLSGQPQPPVGGMPAMPSMPSMPGMPGMPDMNPEMMNAMFQSMQAQGISDPGQMDFGAFMQQMQQMGGMPGMPAAAGGMGGGQGGQNFGGAFGSQNMQHQNSNQGQNGFSGGYGGGTPQPQQQGLNQPQSYENYSPQQIAMLQQQQGGGQGGGRGRGRGRRW